MFWYNLDLMSGNFGSAGMSNAEEQKAAVQQDEEDDNEPDEWLGLAGVPGVRRELTLGQGQADLQHRMRRYRPVLDNSNPLGH